MHAYEAKCNDRLWTTVDDACILYIYLVPTSLSSLKDSQSSNCRVVLVVSSFSSPSLSLLSSSPPCSMPVQCEVIMYKYPFDNSFYTLLNTSNKSNTNYLEFLNTTLPACKSVIGQSIRQFPLLNKGTTQKKIKKIKEMHCRVSTKF